VNPETWQQWFVGALVVAAAAGFVLWLKERKRGCE
jgi:hypothetical protein